MIVIRRLSILLALVLAGSCGRDLTVTDYSTTCTVDADCTPVFVGDPCTGCSCSNASINVSSRAKYDADAAAQARLCSPLRPQCLADCVQPVVVCLAGRCALKAPQ